MTDIFKFAPGDRVEHIITGFKGVVMARTEWFNGCIRYQVQKEDTTKEGAVPPNEPFDEAELKAVGKPIPRPHLAPAPKPEPLRRTGGPHPATPRGQSVSRRA